MPRCVFHTAANAQGPGTSTKCLHCDVIYCRDCLHGSKGKMTFREPDDKVVLRCPGCGMVRAPTCFLTCIRILASSREGRPWTRRLPHPPRSRPGPLRLLHTCNLQSGTRHPHNGVTRHPHTEVARRHPAARPGGHAPPPHPTRTLPPSRSGASTPRSLRRPATFPSRCATPRHRSNVG